MQITGNSYRLQPLKEMILFRMAQEALNKAVKHSKRKILKCSWSTLLESAKTGIGLKSMQNRTALIGGIFSVVSDIVTGAIIAIKLNSSKMLV